MTGLVKLTDKLARRDADFAVHIRIQNGPLLRAILDAGHENVSQFCKQYNFSPSRIGELLNMKISPFNKDGDWVGTVKKLSEVLGPLPEELFPDAVREPLPRYRATAWAFADEIRSLIVGPPESPEALVIKRDMVNAIRCEANLTKRENAVLEMRFNGDLTRDEMAKVLDVSGERERQIEEKTITRLRNAAKRLEARDEDGRMIRRYGVRYISGSLKRPETPEEEKARRATEPPWCTHDHPPITDKPVTPIKKSKDKRHPAHVFAEHLSDTAIELAPSRAGEQFTVAGFTFTYVKTELNTHIFSDDKGHHYSFMEIPQVVMDLVKQNSEADK